MEKKITDSAPGRLLALLKAKINSEALRFASAVCITSAAYGSKNISSLVLDSRFAFLNMFLNS